MKKKIKWALVILWMIIIFMFSNDPATISDSKSRFVIYIFKLLGLNLNSYFGNLANFIVRKGGHTFEYFLLLILLYNALREYFKVNKAILISLLIQFFYASTDEFHQLFVPGRAGRFTDVLIDTCGGLIGILLIKIVLYIKGRKKK